MAAIKFFSGQESQYLAEKITKAYGEPLGSVDIQRFSDGELQPSYEVSVRGAIVFIIQ